MLEQTLLISGISEAKHTGISLNDHFDAFTQKVFFLPQHLQVAFQLHFTSRDKGVPKQAAFEFPVIAVPERQVSKWKLLIFGKFK